MLTIADLWISLLKVVHQRLIVLEKAVERNHPRITQSIPQIREITFLQSKWKENTYEHSLFSILTATTRDTSVNPQSLDVGNPKIIPFDSDSYPILIDNCCTACVTNEMNDFEGTLQKVQTRVNGVGGAIMLTHKGTIKWTIEDNEGCSHTFRIRNSFYAPDAPCRLLSPQHWSQNAEDNSANKKGTWSATYDDKVELHWNNNSCHRTIKLDPATNVASMQSSPGNKYFRTYYMMHTMWNDSCIHACFNTQLIMDDEASYSDDTSRSGKENSSSPIEPTVEPEKMRTLDHEKEHTLIDFHDEIITADKEGTKQVNSPSSELMAIHQKLNHISFWIIKLMAANGHYPKWLVDCWVPKYSACLFCKSTCHPWWVKAQQNGSSKLCTYPGQCVPVDQLESPTPGLIAQLKGIPTTKQYKAATIFVDHFSRLSFVHLQSTLTSEDTLQAKKAFQKYSESNGVHIKHYHADNCRFVDKTFTNDVIANNQRVTYCGINAHFQNGVAEKRIQDLQDLT